MLGMEKTAPGSITITDSRPCALAPSFELSGLEAEVYDLCDPGVTLDALANLLSTKSNKNNVSRDRLSQILDKFTDLRILTKITGYYLNLAVKLPCRDYVFMEKRPGGNIRPLSRLRPSELTIEQVYGIDFSA